MRPVLLLPLLLALVACSPTPTASLNTASVPTATPKPAPTTTVAAPAGVEPQLVISQESAGGNSHNVVEVDRQDGGVVISQVTQGDHSANVVVLGDASDQATVAGKGNVVVSQRAHGGAGTSTNTVQVVSGNGNVVISSHP